MSVSKPTSYLNWNPSQSNCIQPPSGLMSAGWVPNQVVDAQYLNWDFNLTDQWIQWFDQLTTTTLVQVTSNYTVASSGVKTILANPSSGTFTVTLEAASSVAAGTRHTIKNTGFGSSNQVNVGPTGSDNIENVNASTALLQGEYITVVSDGVSQWLQVG